MDRIVAKPRFPLIALAVHVAVLTGGCAQHQGLVDSAKELDSGFDSPVQQVRYEELITTEPIAAATAIPAPFALNRDDTSTIGYWDLTLEEAIQTGLANSSVLRDLGARVLQAPSLTPTVYGPSIQATDPQFGVEAALAAFDAEFSTQAFFEKNDRALNNSLLGGGTNFFLQDLWRIQSELRKRAATGAEFSLRHNVEDDLNNAPANLFGTAPGVINAHAWSWNLEAEIRQPLLQGGGVEFNRIAGPGATPGVANGVLIARVNTEISTADFQLAVRDYLSNIENAYWDLVFAYRDLEVKKTARDRSLETWQLLKRRQEEGIQGIEADKVAQAAEQYYRFQQEVETGLSGRLVVNTRDFNGSTGGTFQGAGGVYVAERRLRLLMGIPINDGQLIRPVTEPSPAEVVLDWDQFMGTALAKRTELLRQRLRVKRRTLELKASRNYLLPSLDVVGRYRRRGLGDHLYDPRVPFDVPDDDMPPFPVDSGSDEWQIGMELSVPIGYRQGHAGVRHAELTLARERAVLGEMERQIGHDVSNAFAEQARIFQAVKTAYNRRVQAERQYKILSSEEVRQTRREADFNLLLDAQHRLAEADTAYQRALVGYAVSLKNLHLESGDLMKYCNIHYADEG